MKNFLVAKNADSGIFAPSVRIEDAGDVKIAYVKDNLRSARKLYDIANGRTVLLEEGCLRKCGAYKKSTISSREITLPVLDKIVSAVAKKYFTAFPIEEIYVMADPICAAQIIAAIRTLARLFTVVSPLETVGKMYDELYFKHGCVIRHIPSFNNADWENAVVIKCDGEDSIARWIRSPVISLDKCSSVTDKTFLAGSIHITDERTKKIEKLLGIKSGAPLYAALEIVPCENAEIYIGEKCSEIFTLDIGEI